MSSAFASRSAYGFTSTPIPSCFLDLEAHLDRRLPAPYERFMHSSNRLAENLCRRMGDADWYAGRVEEALGTLEPFPASVMAGTLLVGHFSACKSVLDAVAIAVARIHHLGRRSRGSELADRDMDLAKGRFWAALRAEQPKAYAR